MALEFSVWYVDDVKRMIWDWCLCQRYLSVMSGFGGIRWRVGCLSCEYSRGSWLTGFSVIKIVCLCDY